MLTRRRSIVYAALYLAATLLSAGHEVLFAPPRCATCETQHPDGVHVESFCEERGPCTNPGHHHHAPRHQHEHCPFCAHGSAPGL